MKIGLLKRIAVAMLAVAVLGMTACSPAPDDNTRGEAAAEVRLTLWTYPVGGWSNLNTVSSLLSSFHRKYSNIRIGIKEIDYVTGDSEVEKAIADGNAPDLVFEGPERLIANWGARDLMADISDVWEDEVSADIDDSVRSACRAASGEYYEYPVCMTTHCMAINRDMFERAGALDCIDETTHTWTTEGFKTAVERLYAARNELGIEDVAVVYCNGQGGDQGTRALVNNLYGGTFTDEAHTSYTVDDPKNIAALELLQSMDGIRFAADCNGVDEIAKFNDEKIAMAFCWNVSQEMTRIVKNQDVGLFESFPMAFPTSEGDPILQGGIWGFGVFDNGDEDRVEAAKTFIRYMTADEDMYRRAVLVSSYWPVRPMPELYKNDELMSEYSIFSRYLGDYYQVTSGWADARTAWWKMLQEIGEKGDVRAAVEGFGTAVNGKK